MLVALYDSAPVADAWFSQAGEHRSSARRKNEGHVEWRILRTVAMSYQTLVPVWNIG